jgi:site-specific recombinase XerD
LYGLRDLRTGLQRRHHFRFYKQSVQKAVKDAAGSVWTSPVSRTFCATILRPIGYDIRPVQELIDHANVHTSLIHTHVLNFPISQLVWQRCDLSVRCDLRDPRLSIHAKHGSLTLRLGRFQNL